MHVQKRRSFSSIERPSALAGGVKTPDHDVMTSFDSTSDPEPQNLNQLGWV